MLTSRIIPARAGFTVEWRFQRREEQDHPRSRGVYPIRIIAPWSITGSSPLARGLRSDSMAEYKSLGIIPARAGFTATWQRRFFRRTDHPRSRGVYPPVEVDFTPIHGSSPLARGLRRRVPRHVIDTRIIPARAGFTTRCCSCWTPGKDHPRSRGVYIRARSPRVRECGSSPLARGLPDGYAVISGKARIIPARAGFTTIIGVPVNVVRDHPRSRGVYWIGLCGTISTIGSSPLARGLLQWTRRKCPRRRIIPARAGFTLFLQ